MKDTLIQALTPFGQQHLVSFWNELTDVERETLAQEIRSIDLAQIDRLSHQGGSATDWAELARRAEPPLAFCLDEKLNKFTSAEARARGAEALAAGQVAAILVAGGQGTRLGFDHPKGMLPIGPVSNHSLFQILLEQVLAAGRRDGVRIPLYVMTSPATHEETVRYFAENGRFGLAEDDVKIFCQGTMPAVDSKTGKILLEGKGRLALSPDGHGGTVKALLESGSLTAISQRGIRQLFYFQVDNPLVRVCDPEFIGDHLLSDSELSSYVVEKAFAEERLGNLVRVDGRLQIIEYSDLPNDVAQRRNADGSLEFWAGSIAIHVFDVAFLERMAGYKDSLPMHAARKKVPCIDERGQLIQPEEPNAIKFERFIFDLLPHAKNAIAVEGDRRETFGPVKNATGQVDTAATAQALMVGQHTRWLQKAGAKIDDGVPVEISPLFAMDAEEVSNKIDPGLHVTEPRFFC